MKLSIAAAIGLLALSLTEAAKTGSIKANPLPKPVNINWESSGRIHIGDLKYHGPRNEVLVKAFDRTASYIKKKWVPQSWEAPMPEWPKVPSTLPRDLGKRGDDDGDVDDDVEVENGRHRGAVNRVNVKVDDSEADLQHGVDESYNLKVTTDGTINIKAKTIWGALHAFTTLQQIVISDNGRNLFIEQPVTIDDVPKYTHRGVMYDTARNFIPIKNLKKQVEALAFSKLNVFHWHITDSQAWPLEIKHKDYRAFTRGAYSHREIYTQEHVRDLVKFARAHGVRVIPEIDMPAHSNKGWASVDPKTVACGDSWWSNDVWEHHSAVQPNPGHLDISYPGTYKILGQIFPEIAGLFKDDIFHVGFDELMPNCYEYSALTREWFDKNPGVTYNDLAQIWVNNTVEPIFKKSARRLMMWEDSVLFPAMHADIPKDVIMQSWNNGVDNIHALVKKGYDVVVTSADFFYLDCGHGGYVTNDARYNQQYKPPMNETLTKAFDAVAEYNNPYSPTLTNYGGAGASWCAPYKTWQRIYSYDFTWGLNDEEAKKVIGGEAAMWAEQVDATNLDTKVWPRAAALAELLWSGNRDSKGDKRTTELSARIFEFRERLVDLGLNASPLVPKFCIQNPHQCDLYKDQNVFAASDKAQDKARLEL
ncbi:hypothetical protein DFQ27_003300 [Actinomortierella ambigua]|uniref:Beta-hexosaminidase n=1 Tax=Actinomortierella ambigua TaxID=1343610 RepID=A0A9P6U5T3_9FUNG|nr:hypothetical protein DFQ27_003300 [Actinomortierella ambigua]